MINPLFQIAPSLEMYFVDKDTGLPLAAGQVFFWSDVNRNVPKPVYTISGPPDYVYTELPNPVTLSAVGTFQDASGNDIVPYYYPYTGSPSSPTGVVELYYIEVFNSGGVLQFTRQAWPNFSGQSATAAAQYFNYIPNGQFLVHYNINGTGNFKPGQITNAVTALAPGGWYFVRPSVTTSVDTITFPVVPQPPNVPSGNPRFSCELVCSNPNPADATKDIEVRFGDVNKFASTTQNYTFYFAGISNTGSSLTGSIILKKNFGTGGSAATETVLGSFTLGTSYTNTTISFIFGVNSGKTVGTLNDDYVAIALRFPNSLLDITIDDSILAFGTVTFPTGTQFLDETNADMTTRSVFGSLPIPSAAGFDLYLPFINSPTGVISDTSQLCKIYISAISTLGVGELLCDGTSYINSRYSSDRIPYARAGQKLFLSSPSFSYKWGQGYQYVSALSSTGSGAPNSFIFTYNQAGVYTTIADGGVATGFTYSNVCTGNSGYNVFGYVSTGASSPRVYVKSAYIGAVTAPADGSSPTGFTFTTYTNTPLTRQFFAINVVAPTSGLAGKFFTFYSNNVSSSTTGYYVWFTWNGSGSDPAPGGGLVGIKVNLYSTIISNALDLIQTIASAISGFQQTVVSTIPSGASIVPSSYFTYTTAVDVLPFAGYYIVDGVGTAPAVNANIFPIPVASTDSSTTIVIKTRQAINLQCWGTPDLTEAFVRGPLTVGPHFQDISVERYTATGDQESIGSDFVGTYEQDTFADHLHGFTSTGSNPGVLVGTSGLFDFGSGSHAVVALSATDYTGFEETRPYNAIVNFIMKY